MPTCGHSEHQVKTGNSLDSARSVAFYCSLKPVRRGKMVLKGTKREIRSGNTFRNICSRADAQKHKAGIIVRTSHDLRLYQTNDGADDNHLTANSVAFSLSKKGRWNLPDVIQERLSSESFETNSCGLAISMLEHHTVNRQSDCLRITSNHINIGTRCSVREIPMRKKARRKNYCNGLNVLNNGRGKSTKETRKKQVISSKIEIEKRKYECSTVNEEEDRGQKSSEEVTAPTVRYDVYYPLPLKSSLRFHPKFSSERGCNDGIEGLLRPTPGLKYNKGTKQRYRNEVMDIFFDLVDDDTYCDDWDENEDDTDFEGGKFFEEDETNTSQGFANSSDILETVLQAASSNSRADVTDFLKACPRKRSQTKRKKEFGKTANRYMYRTERESLEECRESDVDSCVDETVSSSSSETDWVVLPSGTQTRLQPTKMTYLKIFLPRSAVTSSTLKHLYGARYVEGDSTPRRFTIDITDDVASLVRNNRQYRHLCLPTLDLSACVIFIDDGSAGRSEETLEESRNLYRVALNMNLSSEKIDVNTLKELTAYENVADVIQRVHEFVATLSPDLLNRREAGGWVLGQVATTDFNAVSMANRWRVSCIHLPSLASGMFSAPAATETATKPAECITEPARQMAAPQTATGDIVNLEESRNEAIRRHDGKECRDAACFYPPSTAVYCSICYEDVTPQAGGTTATALTSCRHWFCDGCWRAHLVFAARDVTAESGLNLQCPEFRCNATVDEVTLLSFLNVAEVHLLKRRRLELQVTKSAPNKWCPNQLCGRLIKLESESESASLTTGDEPRSLTCTCGEQLCFSCLQGAHWPASCQEQLHYLDLVAQKNGMKHTKSGDLPVVKVAGKKCPNCRVFFEKNGGCDHMTCRCGYHFCWLCSKRYYGPNGEGHVCKSHRQVAAHVTVFVRHVETPKPSLQSRWFTFSFRHRKARCARGMWSTRKMAEQLRRRLQDLASKGVDIGVAGEWDEGEGQLKLCITKQGKQPLVINVTGFREEAKARSGRSSHDPSVQEIHGRISHATLTMMRLKIELHHVLEYTGVVLNAREKAGNTPDTGKLSRDTGSGAAAPHKIEEVVERTEDVITALDSLMQTTSAQHLRKVLPWFRSLHAEAVECMKNLKQFVTVP